MNTTGWWVILALMMNTALWLLAKATSARYIVLVPLLGERTRFALRSQQDDLMLVAETGDPALACEAGAALYVAVGEDPYALQVIAARAVSAHIGAGRLRAELRPTPLTVHTISPGYLRTALTAGNTFAMPGLLEPDAAARALLQGVAQGREHIVLPRRIGWLSQALSLLPAPWHDRILLGQPRKPRAGQAGSTPIPGLNTPSP